jgi:hypothetical protein
MPLFLIAKVNVIIQFTKKDPVDMIKTLQKCKEEKEKEGKEFQLQLVSEFLQDLHHRKLKVLQF